MSEQDGPIANNAQRSERAMASVVLVIGCGVAYWIWPGGITENTLSQITLAEFARLLASIITAVAFFVMALMLWF
jgi:hypothetical protein